MSTEAVCSLELILRDLMCQMDLACQVLGIHHSGVIDAIVQVSLVLREENTVPRRPFDVLPIPDQPETEEIHVLADRRVAVPDVIDQMINVVLLHQKRQRGSALPTILIGSHAVQYEHVRIVVHVRDVAFA